jgi:hypothetical protein
MPLTESLFEEEREEFRRLARSVAAYYQEAGCDALPYENPALPHFSRLPAAARGAALAHLRSTWSLLAPSAHERESRGNNAQALWAMLKASGLAPPPDLFSRLEQDDLLELYEPGGLQLWRNLGVMKICSYSIEELHSFDWAARYERKDSDTAAIFGIVAAILKEGFGGAGRYEVPAHLVRERFARRNYLLQVHHGDFVALRGRAGEVGGLLVRSKARILAEDAHEFPAVPRLRLCPPADAPV